MAVAMVTNPMNVAMWNVLLDALDRGTRIVWFVIIQRYVLTVFHANYGNLINLVNPSPPIYISWPTIYDTMLNMLFDDLKVTVFTSSTII